MRNSRQHTEITYQVGSQGRRCPLLVGDVVVFENMETELLVALILD